MYLTYDDKTIRASLDWEDISVTDFYDKMRKGCVFKTAQITPERYKQSFEKYILDGYDILSVSCSSALSSSFDGSTLARDYLREKYPDAQIYCVDSLNSCKALGFMCIMASKLRAQGKTIKQVYDYLEDNKLKFNQFATVEDLTYLKRAGRVSTASAFFGGLMQIKPIIVSDVKGRNLAVEKVKGRKNSKERIVQRVVETYRKSELNAIAILHADCIDECLELTELIKSRLDLDGVEIMIGYLGPIIGASVGPGTLAVYCFGEEVQDGKD
jgi:DegV family protein with EDD domain